MQIQLRIQLEQKKTRFQKENQHLVIQSDLFGMVKWPFKGLSDLQSREENGHFESPSSYVSEKCSASSW